MDRVQKKPNSSVLSIHVPLGRENKFHIIEDWECCIDRHNSKSNNKNKQKNAVTYFMGKVLEEGLLRSLIWRWKNATEILVTVILSHERDWSELFLPLCHSLFPQVTKKNIADFVTLSSL
jgi:hypothetical protein